MANCALLNSSFLFGPMVGKGASWSVVTHIVRCSYTSCCNFLLLCTKNKSNPWQFNRVSFFVTKLKLKLNLNLKPLTTFPYKVNYIFEKYISDSWGIYSPRQVFDLRLKFQFVRLKDFWYGAFATSASLDTVDIRIGRWQNCDENVVSLIIYLQLTKWI